MPPSKERLTRQKDFTRIYREGKACYNQATIIKILPNQLIYNRYAIVVSNKVSNKSTIRNKIRRQIRAVIIKQRPLLKVGFDILIITKNEIVHYSFADIAKDVINGLAKQELYLP